MKKESGVLKRPKVEKEKKPAKAGSGFLRRGAKVEKEKPQVTPETPAPPPPPVEGTSSFNNMSIS